MHKYRKERSIMKDFLTIVSGGLGILTAFLGAIGIEAGFIVSVVLCILKLASIRAIGWGVVLAPTLIPLGLFIGGFILMGIVHVFLN